MTIENHSLSPSSRISLFSLDGHRKMLFHGLGTSASHEFLTTMWLLLSYFQVRTQEQMMFPYVSFICVSHSHFTNINNVSCLGRWAATFPQHTWPWGQLQYSTESTPSKLLDCLVGGWALPLWKILEFVSWDDEIPIIFGNINPCSKPPTSCIL